MTPKKIGRYVVESELGRGGMAVVYLVTDPFVKRKVAVKLLPRQFTDDPQFRARFQREAQVIASLDHPSIVPIYDFGEHEGQPFIVMRYMTGGTLGQKLRAKGPMPPLEAARILTQIGSALDEAHSKGIVHRDMKPGNILFDHRGDAAIADFGIVKLAESSNTLTGSGMIGTPGYMSPEQARGDADIDRRSDLYALGAILFEMLTGQLPYQADTPMGVAIKHVIDDVPHILNINPNLPPAWDGVISRAMAKQPADRYGSAVEMAATITSLAQTPTQQSAPAVDMTRIEVPPARPTPPPVKKQPTPQPAPPKPAQHTAFAESQTAVLPGQKTAPPVHAAPPGQTAPPPVATPSPQQQPQPAAKKRPLWLLPVVGIILLFLCIGGAVGISLATGLIGGDEATATATTAIITDGSPTPPANIDPDSPLAQAQAATVKVAGLGAPFIENIIGSGSGFVYNDSGLVVTNYHLVEGAESIQITDPSGRTTTAELLGSSPCDDIAILQLTTPDLPAGPTDSAVLQTGSPLSVVSYSEETDLQFIASAALDSSGQDAAGFWGSFQDAIQVSGTFNPAQSGAPLVADDGNIAGILTLSLEPDQSGATAVSIETIRPLLSDLTEQDNHNWLGLNIGPLPSSLPGTVNIIAQPGLFVYGVGANSPAAQIDIQAGDFITEIGGTAVTNDNDLATYCQILGEFQENDLLDITVQRDDQTLTGQINGQPLASPTTATPTAGSSPVASATLRPTNTNTPSPTTDQATNTAVPATNTPAAATNTPVPPTAPPPTSPPPTSPPPTSPPPTSPPPTSPPPTSPPPTSAPPTNTPEPP